MIACTWALYQTTFCQFTCLCAVVCVNGMRHVASSRTAVAAALESSGTSYLLSSPLEECAMPSRRAHKSIDRAKRAMKGRGGDVTDKFRTTAAGAGDPYSYENDDDGYDDDDGGDDDDDGQAYAPE